MIINYEKAVGFLKKNKPVLTDKELLVKKVMQNLTGLPARSSLPKMAGRYLFSWVYVGWVRKTMATAAILFFGFFIFQQLTLNKRVARLESRMIKSSITPPDFRTTPDLKQRLFFELVARKTGDTDSITLSKDDFSEFLQSYSDLQAKYEKIKKHVKKDSFLDKVLKKNLDKNLDKNGTSSDL